MSIAASRRSFNPSNWVFYPNGKIVQVKSLGWVRRHQLEIDVWHLYKNFYDIDHSKLPTTNDFEWIGPFMIAESKMSQHGGFVYAAAGWYSFSFMKEWFSRLASWVPVGHRGWGAGRYQIPFEQTPETHRHIHETGSFLDVLSALGYEAPKRYTNQLHNEKDFAEISSVLGDWFLENGTPPNLISFWLGNKYKASRR
jgi:hypothetical protein